MMDSAADGNDFTRLLSEFEALWPTLDTGEDCSCAEDDETLNDVGIGSDLLKEVEGDGDGDEQGRE